MGSGMRWARLAALVLLAGCGSVLGIEELSSEGGDASTGDPGGSGDSGRGGNAGGGNAGSANAGSNGAGRSGGGGSGGAAGMDGGAEAGSGAAGSAGSGTAGSAGSGTAGTGGSNDDGGMPDTGMPSTPTVHGKVVDYYRNPMKGVVIKIGDATATTDADGKFTLDDVSATYDVSLSISTLRYGNQETIGWLFVGLTRRDPTLQVYRGHPYVDGDVLITTNPDTLFPLPDYDQIAWAYGSTWSEYHATTSSPAVQGGISWEGPNQISGTVHGLRWSNAINAPHLPVGYHAQAEQALSMDVANSSTLTLNLGGSGSPLPSAMVSGTVTAPTFAERSNAVFLRYTDDAALQLVDHRDGPDTFSYLVPSSIANTSITVAATVNTSSFKPFAVAYKEGITPGTTGIALEVPSPATLVAPGHGATAVDGSTMFSWTGADQVYLFHVESETIQDGVFYVVTTAKQARIPAAPVTNIPLRANHGYYWDVSTHIPRATVDDATGPDGFLDAYCDGWVSGSARGSGSHTMSVGHGFTSK